MAFRVKKLFVGIWKCKPACSTSSAEKESVCVCDSCIDALGKLVENLKLNDIGKKIWMEELRNPTEATVRGLIFAALPNLKEVSCMRNHSPRDLRRRNFMAKISHQTW